MITLRRSRNGHGERKMEEEFVSHRVDRDVDVQLVDDDFGVKDVKEKDKLDSLEAVSVNVVPGGSTTKWMSTR